MYTIKHLIHFDTDIQYVYKSIATIEGLRQWWTVQTTGVSELNETIDFRFGERYFIQMKVIELEPNKMVRWECVQAEPDWIGTIITFDLDLIEGKIVLRFSHDKWPTHSDFFAHCNLSWAKYLLSLKLYLENGKGSPFKPD
ncbi:MAG: SRPBCC domain-containing protein [Flavobacteriaceae bacterium]|nr:SRPBCC domain-containing protein [Flavobacteriaceae bacterium]